MWGNAYSLNIKEQPFIALNQDWRKELLDLDHFMLLNSDGKKTSLYI